jgi:hypothetical protein
MLVEERRGGYGLTGVESAVPGDAGVVRPRGRRRLHIGQGRYQRLAATYGVA